LSVTYGPYSAYSGRHAISVEENDLYNGFARLAWSIGVACVVVSCSLGQGGKN